MAEQESNPQLKTVYFNDAIKFSKRSLDILPSNKDALYNIALTYQVMHNFAEAKKAFQNVLKYYPDFKSAFNNLGSIFIQENNFDSAYFYIKRCYDLDSSVPKSSQNLAIYYFQTSDFQQSIKFAQNAIRLNPNMKISYEILIKIYQNEGNTAERDKYQRLYREMLASTTEENSEQVE